ncbi:hypothetical protein [Corallococcus sp. CA054B]|uniref:hypothetical protein n=1 Tax=Corallococcus sp. CA054B TaxID=2316734 RepID=UPI0011C383E6|nr:hypothetical protein [Corallococcus sp. CA054B]
MKTKTSFLRYRALSLLMGGLLLASCEKDPAKPEPIPDDAPIPDDVKQSPMSPGTHGEGELTEEGQRVRYELATKAGYFYRFSCQGDTLLGCEVRRLDPGTLEPLPPAATSDRTYVSWRAEVDETAIVDVGASLPSQVQVGRYTFDFSETEDTEPNTVQDAIFKEVPSRFTGVLNDVDDVDVFRFSIPKGHILAVVCYFIPGGSGMGPRTQMVRADGTVLNTHSYLHRRGERALSAENDTGEDLFLRVFTWADGRYMGGYSCQAADDGVDEHPDAPPEATVVTVPSTTDVNFWPEGDVDVLAVDLVEGHTYRVTSNGFSFYPSTTVLDAQGTVLGKDLEDPDTLRLVAEFTAPSTARYFLSLRRLQGFGVYVTYYDTEFTYSISDVTP